MTQSAELPIATERGGQYSADHIQWYPLGTHTATPQFRRRKQVRVGSSPTYAGGKYDEAVEAG